VRLEGSDDSNMIRTLPPLLLLAISSASHPGGNSQRGVKTQVVPSKTHLRYPVFSPQCVSATGDRLCRSGAVMENVL